MRPVTWQTRVRGLLFGLLCFLSPIYGIIFMTGWMLPMLYINAGVYRRMIDFMVGWWFYFPAALTRFLLGVNVRVTGDVIRHGESNLILMNHRTRLDWMYLWSVLVQQSGPHTEKIVLKSPLKMIPGAGWAMQAGAFMFLVRRWEEDQIYMTELMDYFASSTPELH